MKTLILSLLLAINHPAGPTKNFDRVDINHVYDPHTGQHRFTQLIYYDWSRGDRRFGTFGFTMAPGIVSGPTWNGRAYEFVVQRSRRRWTIVTGIVIESSTIYDPEAVDRQRYPDLIRDWDHEKAREVD